MDNTRHGGLYSAPTSLQLSAIGIPSLEPIPGSAAPTPSLHNLSRESTPEDVASPPRPDHASFDTETSVYLTPSEASHGPYIASRRSSLAGSYFPSNAQAGPSSPASASVYPSTVASGANTPSERIRPAPIAIPVATPDEPLFSAYPDGVASEAEIRHPPGSKGKGRAFKLSFRTPFTLGQPPRKKNGHDEPNFDPQSTSTAANLPTRPKPGRRRASTFSGSPPEMTPISDQRRNSLNTSRMPSGYTRSLRRLSRRKTSRSSAASDASGEQSADNAGEDAAPPLQSNWPDMLMEERRRMELRPDRLPFTYGQPASSVFTLQSDTTARPAVSPPISPRRSSLVDCTPPSGGDLNSLLGLTDGVTNQPIEYIIPSDLSIPHDPPPRRSSLSFGPAAIKTLIEPLYGKADSAELGSRRMSADMGSVLSSSLTGTDTSASAEFFSTSPSSREHPLSSATTSLSRSAKSKDASIQDHSSEMHGVADQETRMNAIRLQRSLEWEARQIRHRRKLEKRKLIILELVETEVGYVDDLTTLVHVYLPQLYALPNVSSHTAEHIARNAGELLEVHSKLVTSMVDVLKYEDVGYAPDLADDVAGKLERVSRKLALLFVENVTAFSAYSTYCAGSIAAASLVRHISARTDYDAFERRCQVISSSHVHQTLEDLLADTAQDGGSTSPTAGKPPTTPSNKSRLQFRDFLIMPIQRVCKYPLLLNQLLGAATTPSPVREREQPTFVVGEAEFDIGVDVERALGAMRGVAEDADEARRLKEVEVKTNTIIARLEPHPALPMRFLKSLGPCRLIGSLDVLHHHPIIAPLAPPVKVKYMAAFLFRGYLILAKVKKGAVYEAKHFLPLEVFELIDIAEGFLPHSIRLSLRDHNFDLAASCETEKEVWSSALCQARDESTVPPFELPASVSPFAARPRRMSVTMPSKVDLDASGSTMTPSTSAAKRHTVAFSPDEVDFSDFMPAKETDELQDLTYSRAPAASPIKTHFGFTPDRLARATPSTIWFRRASASQRLIVDRGLIDVFSENCATARSKAQLQHTLFLPESANGRGEVRDRLSMRDSTMLRRRQSFLDSRPSSSDIAFSGAEIKGSVLPIRQSRSMGGRQRGHQRASSAKMSLNDSSTELDYKHVRYASMSGAPSMESADETATSDFGTLTRRQSKSILNGESTVGSMSRNESPAPSRRTSLTNLRAEWARNTDFSASTLASRLSLSRRQSSSMSLSNRAIPNRAKSMPVSPIRSPEKDLPPVPSLNHDMSVVQQPAPKLSTSLTRLKSGTRSSPGSPIKASQRTRLQHVGGAEGGMAIGDVAMYLHGEGITNQAPAIERRNSGPWSTLRRSMSFIRDNNTPNDTRDTGVSSSNSSNSDHHPQLQSRLSFSRPSYSRRQSGNTDDGPISDADTTNAESIDGDGYGSHSREDSYGTGAGTGAKDSLAEEEAKRPEAPKRRKSVKIFSQLSRLTPL